MALGFFSADFLDYDSEAANLRGHTVLLTAANWAAKATLMGNFMSAVTALTAGVIRSYRYGNYDVVGYGPATSPNAQRELKMLVRFVDTVNNRPDSIELPCPDLANLDPNDRANFEIGDAGVIDAFVTAFEAYAMSIDLNPVTITELTLVGRRL